MLKLSEQANRATICTPVPRLEGNFFADARVLEAGALALDCSSSVPLSLATIFAMKLLRRRDKRVDLQVTQHLDCQIVHPYENTLSMRGRVLDLGIGGMGLHFDCEELPDWAQSQAVIVRADLPEVGCFLRRMARMHHQRATSLRGAFGYVWDGSEELSRAYDRLQSSRLQRFLAHCASRDAAMTDLAPLDQQNAGLLRLGYERSENDDEIIRIERLPAGIV